MAPRFLVVGAGGIGGIVSAHLHEQGLEVTTLTTNPLIADAINAHGFRVRGEDSPGTVKGRAVQRVPSRAMFDYVLLATQPPQVEDAARSVVEHLSDTGVMVCFQNGLCEERVARIAGDTRVVGAIVSWGASMIEPGIYDRTSSGGFQLGRLDGREDDRVRELAQVLECIGPTTMTKNLRGARWSKLAINAAISSLGTIGGDRLGVLMRHRYVRRLALEVMTEATEVARALGIQLEKVAGTIDLDWVALTDEDKKSLGSPSLVAKHALLLAVGARYRRLRSSMLSAIERGRPPAIDFLNGEIVDRGRAVGVPTPLNLAIKNQVLAIAAGKAKSSHGDLRAFFDRTRAILQAAAEASTAVPPAPPTEPEARRPAPTKDAPAKDAPVKDAPTAKASVKVATSSPPPTKASEPPPAKAGPSDLPPGLDPDQTLRSSED
ncbi:MAG: 2-dehydropantoate 2-reductase [Polyangiaceae bacterium]